MKKKILLFLLILAIAPLLLRIVQMTTDYSYTLRANWAFGLPVQAHCHEIYSKQAESNFHGDGVRYHVFTYEQEKPIEAMFLWSDTESRTRHFPSYRLAATNWLDEIHVPPEERPDYSNCRFWYQGYMYDEIILMWDSTAERLFIVEFFL